MSSASKEVLLRGYSALGDSRAVEVFDDMIQTCCEQVEIAITVVVSLCAEPRYVQMAEHALGHIRESNGHATFALYSALMYSHASLYRKFVICKLDVVYDQTHPCRAEAKSDLAHLDCN